MGLPAIVAAGLASAVFAPNGAQAKKFNPPANLFLTGVALYDYTVGSYVFPETIAVTPNNEKVYVAGETFDFPFYDEVFAINAINDTVIANIYLGTEDEFAFGVAIDPKGEFVYVSVEGDTPTEGYVAQIDTATNTVVGIATFADVGPFPLGLAVSPDNKYLWIANSGTAPEFNNGTVTVLSLPTGTPVALIPTGNSPEQIVFSPNGKEVYALNSAGYASVIDANTGNITNPTFGLGITASEGYSLSVNKKDVFIGNEFTSVAELTTKGTLKAWYNLFPLFVSDTFLGQTAVTKNGQLLYVTEPGIGEIGWIDLVSGTAETLDSFYGYYSYYLAMSPDSTRLYAGGDDGFLEVYDIQQ